MKKLSVVVKPDRVSWLSAQCEHGFTRSSSKLSRKCRCLIIEFDKALKIERSWKWALDLRVTFRPDRQTDWEFSTGWIRTAVFHHRLVKTRVSFLCNSSRLASRQNSTVVSSLCELCSSVRWTTRRRRRRFVAPGCKVTVALLLYFILFFLEKIHVALLFQPFFSSWASLTSLTSLTSRDNLYFTLDFFWGGGILYFAADLRKKDYVFFISSFSSSCVSCGLELAPETPSLIVLTWVNFLQKLSENFPN